MKKIAQTLTFLFVVAMTMSACTTLPEDPRSWETPGVTPKKNGYVPFQTKKAPIDNTGEIPHHVDNDDPDHDDDLGQI